MKKNSITKRLFKIIANILLTIIIVESVPFVQNGSEKVYAADMTVDITNADMGTDKTIDLGEIPYKENGKYVLDINLNRESITYGPYIKIFAMGEPGIVSQFEGSENAYDTIHVELQLNYLKSYIGSGEQSTKYNLEYYPTIECDTSIPPDDLIGVKVTYKIVKGTNELEIGAPSTMIYGNGASGFSYTSKYDDAAPIKFYNGATAYSTFDEYFANLKPGTQSFRIATEANELYNASTSETKTFVVSKKVPVLKLAGYNRDEMFAATVESEEFGITKILSSTTYEIRYKKDGAADSEYTTIRPDKGGDYVAKAFITDTDYQSLYENTAEVPFTVARIDGAASLSIADIEYGGTITPVITSTNYEASTAVISYKKTSESEYYSTVPTEPGEYNAIAYFPQNDNYNEFTTAPCTFNIGKKTNTVTISAPATGRYHEFIDITATMTDVAGGLVFYVNDVETPSSGNSIGIYFGNMEPGTYSVYALCKANAEYKEAKSATVTVVVEKGKTTLTISGIQTGAPLKAKVIGDEVFFSSEYTLKFKKKGQPDSAYTTVVPDEAGDYVAIAELIPAYASTWENPTTEFTILRKEGEVKFSIADINYKEKLNPVIKTESYNLDTAKITYKRIDKAGTSYTSVEPTMPGKYTAKLYFPKNAKYEEYETTCNFEIKKIEGAAKVVIPNYTYGEGKLVLNITTTDYDEEKAVVVYRDAKSTSSSYTSRVPSKPGKYIAMVTFAENDCYLEHVEECAFEILKAPGSGKVFLDDYYVGMTPKITATSSKNGIDAVIYEYKLSSEKDSAYTNVIPDKPGVYTIRATFPTTEFYLEAIAEDTFEVTYLPSPGFKIEGEQGRNEFYTSDVTIKVPEGYQISTSFGTGYVDFLKYSVSSKNRYLYFKEIATGALSDKVEMPRFKIDSTKPEFEEDIKDNDVLFSDESLFNINDDNLESVTVNGETVVIKDGKASISLVSDGGMETYVIVAVDKAGNEISYTITVKSEWMEKGVIPEGQEIKLYSGTGYELEDGEWTVSGDTTVYNGGLKVYVADDTKLLFSK